MSPSKCLYCEWNSIKIQKLCPRICIVYSASEVRRRQRDLDKVDVSSRASAAALDFHREISCFINCIIAHCTAFVLSLLAMHNMRCTISTWIGHEASGVSVNIRLIRQNAPFSSFEYHRSFSESERSSHYWRSLIQRETLQILGCQYFTCVLFGTNSHIIL